MLKVQYAYDLPTDSWIVQITFPNGSKNADKVVGIVEELSAFASELMLNAKVSGSLDETTEKVHGE